MKQLLLDSLKSSVTSGLLILKFVVPLYVLADVLMYFDLLKHLGFLFAPFTSLLDLPPEAAVALASGVFINIYAGIAFAAPLGLSPYQWTVLAVFLGVCHSMVVESAIMAKIGLSYTYSVVLRVVGACLTVIPVLLMPASWFNSAQRVNEVATKHYAGFGDLLLHMVTIFQAHPDILAQYQRWFRYILVDEYQDTNVAQYLWLRALAQGHKNICCVGDDDQSV